MLADGITIIFSPYHVGIRDHRVGNGPNRIRDLGIMKTLENLGVTINVVELDPVDEFEDEIGRSFVLLLRLSTAVTRAVEQYTFPLILSGNCMASAAVACGLGIDDLKFIYFDGHDDLDSPDVNENGYFDAMGLSMLRGESWHAHTKTVPGFKPLKYDVNFLYCGLRDQSEVQRQRVIDAGMSSIWGEPGKKVDFVTELSKELDAKSYGASLVHLDLDVLDDSLGKVNDFPSSGSLFESELIQCMSLVPKKSNPKSLTVCSFDPDSGDGDRIARIAIEAITTFVLSLV
ncbi:arginase [Penicillium malachiteum]|uniref:arginase n=1 Tax=Penicillium malachiteum TaxID=1324776 RepID=UPI00254787C8|nr:arginase [Penicillium malachiteum]KAJ5729565.1 arginase [Penicillium malachiteum]